MEAFWALKKASIFWSRNSHHLCISHSLWRTWAFQTSTSSWAIWSSRNASLLKQILIQMNSKLSNFANSSGARNVLKAQCLQITKYQIFTSLLSPLEDRFPLIIVISTYSLLVPKKFIKVIKGEEVILQTSLELVKDFQAYRIIWNP